MTDVIEGSAVGALLHLNEDQVREARSVFERDDLDDMRLRIVVDLIDAVLTRGARPDPATVLAEARTCAAVPTARLGELGKLLVDLYESVPHPGMAAHYCRAVVEAGVRRHIETSAQRIEQAASANDLTTTCEVLRGEIVSLAIALGRLEGRSNG